MDCLIGKVVREDGIAMYEMIKSLNLGGKMWVCGLRRGLRTEKMRVVDAWVYRL